MTELRYDETGLREDRRYMVVDEEGCGLTQREHPKLALVRPDLAADGSLVLNHERKPSLRLNRPTSKRVPVRIWEFNGEALDMGIDAANWFSEVLGLECRLVMFPAGGHRPISNQHTKLTAEAHFTDGYPIMLMTVESLSELNRRLVTPLPMNRFRPNVVLRDCAPFAEDTWQRLRFPEMTLHVVKPCERCVITTTNQQTLERSKEPLKTLATFRRQNGAVCFGQNCVPEGRGRLSVGDAAARETELSPLLADR